MYTSAVPFIRTRIWVHHTLFAFLGLVLPILSGCTTTVVYDSALPPAPLMNRTGQLVAKATYGSTGGNFNVAYALPGQFIVSGSMQYNESTGDHADPRNQSASTSYSDAHLFRSYEICGGPYFNLEENVVIEFLFGKGHGSGEDYVYTREYWDWHDINILHRETGNFDKLFAQINMGKNTGTSKAGIAVRCSYLNYRDYQKYHSQRGYENVPIPSGVIWEPMAFGEVGTERVKFSINVLYPIVPSTLGIGYRQFIFAAGMEVSLF